MKLSYPKDSGVGKRPPATPLPQEAYKVLADVLGGGGRGVFYRPYFAHVFGGACCALLLSQFWYWTNNPDVRKRGGWFWKSGAEITRETGLTRTERETARRKLAEQGVVIEQVRGCPATVHFRVEKEILFECLWRYILANPDEFAGNLQTVGLPVHQFAGNLQTGVRESRRPDRRKAARQMAEKPQTITDTTSETSPDISSPTTTTSSSADERDVEEASSSGSDVSALPVLPQGERQGWAGDAHKEAPGHRDVSSVSGADAQEGDMLSPAPPGASAGDPPPWPTESALAGRLACAAGELGIATDVLSRYANDLTEEGYADAEIAAVLDKSVKRTARAVEEREIKALTDPVANRDRAIAKYLAGVAANKMHVARAKAESDRRLNPVPTKRDVKLDDLRVMPRPNEVADRRAYDALSEGERNSLLTAAVIDVRAAAPPEKKATVTKDKLFVKNRAFALFCKEQTRLRAEA